MDASIIIALIFGIASVISSFFFGLIPSIRKQKIEKLVKKIEILTKDVKSFYEIETILLEKLASGGSSKALKEEIRREAEKRTNHKLSNYSFPSHFNKDKQ